MCWLLWCRTLSFANFVDVSCADLVTIVYLETHVARWDLNGSKFSTAVVHVKKSAVTVKRDANLSTESFFFLTRSCCEIFRPSELQFSKCACNWFHQRLVSAFVVVGIFDLEKNRRERALEGAEVAPGTLATLRKLTNPERRPPHPCQSCPDVAHKGPGVSYALDQDLFFISVRTARRGEESQRITFSLCLTVKEILYCWQMWDPAETPREVPPSDLLAQSHGRWQGHDASQHGPLGSSVVTAVPTNRVTRFEAQPLRILLPTPLFAVAPCPHAPACVATNLIHRAASSEAGDLGGRCFPLQCAAAQVCREVPEKRRTLSSATWIWPSSEARRTEDRGHRWWVDSFPGPQLAIDNDGVTLPPRRHRVHVWHWSKHAERRRPPAQNWRGWRPSAIGCLGSWAWGRWSAEMEVLLRCLAKAKAETAPLLMQNRVRPLGWAGGAASARQGLSHCSFSRDIPSEQEDLH